MLRGLRHRRAGFSQALATLALLAMVLRALAPPGYMLGSANATSNFAIVTLCTGHGPVDIVIAPKAEKAKPDGKAPRSQSDGPCVFAAAATLAPPEAPPILNMAFGAHVQERPGSADVRPGQGLAAPPPWATGPPSTL